MLETSCKYIFNTHLHCKLHAKKKRIAFISKLLREMISTLSCSDSQVIKSLSFSERT